MRDVTLKALALTRKKIEQTNLDVIQQHTWISRRTMSGCGPEEKMLLHCKLRRGVSSEWSVALYPHIYPYIILYRPWWFQIIPPLYPPVIPPYYYRPWWFILYPMKDLKIFVVSGVSESQAAAWKGPALYSSSPKALDTARRPSLGEWRWRFPMKDPSDHRLKKTKSWFNDLDDLGVAMGNSILGNPQNGGWCNWSLTCMIWLVNDVEWYQMMVLGWEKRIALPRPVCGTRPVCRGAFCILANQTGAHHTRWKDTKPPASHRRWQFSWRACSVNDSRWSALLAWILQIPSVNLTQQQRNIADGTTPARYMSYPSVYPQCNG